MNQRRTQEDQILKLLKERGERGAYAYEMTNTDFMRDRGGAIMQYGRAIHTLRHKMGYNIVNKKRGWFVLVEEKGQVALL
jgi:hypothetical protein